MGSVFSPAMALLALSLVFSTALCRPVGAASAEVKVDKDFLAAVVEKLPPRPFHKDGLHRGTVRDFRLVAIDAKTRSFLLSCRVDGEYRPVLTRPFTERTAADERTPAGWRKFRFDIKATVHIEAGNDGIPRFQVRVEEVKRRELEGVAGTLLLALGGFFDEMVTGIVSGRAALLNEKLNQDVVKKVEAFRQFGVFSGIDYAPDRVVLRFDATRLKSEGIAGYVFEEARPDTIPLHRWCHRRLGIHFYATDPGAPDPKDYLAEGVACYVPARPLPGTIPLYRWHRPKDFLYTTSPRGEGASRRGYRPEGLACYVLAEPGPGTVPLYRFVDPRSQQHFYTRHPHAEFAK